MLNCFIVAGVATEAMEVSFQIDGLIGLRIVSPARVTATLKGGVGISISAPNVGHNVENAEIPLSDQANNGNVLYRQKNILMTKEEISIDLFFILLMLSFMRIATNSIVAMRHSQTKELRSNA